jgi:hypothetical protein
MFGFSALQILLGLINILFVADLNYLCIESVNTNCARKTLAVIPTYNEPHSTAFVFYNSLQEWPNAQPLKFISRVLNVVVNSALVNVNQQRAPLNRTFEFIL